MSPCFCQLLYITSWKESLTTVKHPGSQLWHFTLRNWTYIPNISQTALGVASEPGAQTQWLFQAHTQHFHCGTLCSQRTPTCPSLQLGSDWQPCQQVRQLCTKLVQRNRHMYSDVCAVCVCVCVVAQSCPTLCNPMDCSPPGSSVHGILQESLVQWVAIPFSKGSSRPRDQTQVSFIAGRFFTIWTTREASEGRASNSPFKIFFRLCCNQFSSVAQLCPTLCDPTDYSMPGFPVHRQLPELAQTHVHRVSDATQTSHPLSFSSPPALLLFSSCLVIIASVAIIMLIHFFCSCIRPKAMSGVCLGFFPTYSRFRGWGGGILKKQCWPTRRVAASLS